MVAVKKPKATGKAVAKSTTAATQVPLSGGWMLVKTGNAVVTARAADSVGTLLPKLGKALSKPGIHRDVVFGAKPAAHGRPVFAYSVYPADPTKYVREDAEGNKTLGTVVNGKFKALANR